MKMSGHIYAQVSTGKEAGCLQEPVWVMPRFRQRRREIWISISFLCKSICSLCL